jgi:hypothetical protein
MSTMCCIWRCSIPTCSDQICKSMYECSTMFYITNTLPPIRHERHGRCQGVRSRPAGDPAVFDFHMSKVSWHVNVRKFCATRTTHSGKLRLTMLCIRRNRSMNSCNGTSFLIGTGRGSIFENVLLQLNLHMVKGNA